MNEPIENKKSFQVNRCAHWINLFFRFTLPNSISVSCLIISLQIWMCGIIHNVCSWHRGVECVNRHAVLLILLVQTSLLTYLVRLLHRKVIKLHIYAMHSMKLSSFFVSQHLHSSFVYDDQSLIFSAVVLLVDQSFPFFYFLNSDDDDDDPHHRTMTRRKNKLK